MSEQEEIDELKALLEIFVKSMTSASQAWFPEPMLEAKEKAKKLLEK